MFSVDGHVSVCGECGVYVCVCVCGECVLWCHVSVCFQAVAGAAEVENKGKKESGHQSQQGEKDQVRRNA